MSTSSGESRSFMGIPGDMIALLLILGGMIGAFSACTSPFGLDSGSATATAQAQTTSTAQAQANTTATAHTQLNATATANVDATATAQASATVQAVNATATVTAILAGSCPIPSDVAQAIGVNSSLVSKLTSEPCAFTLPTDTQRTVHCPTRYSEVSFQYVLPGNETQIIRKCDGIETMSFQIYGATVRFVHWESTGDACTIFGKTPPPVKLAPETHCP